MAITKPNAISQWWKSRKGGTMKDGFTFPNLRLPIGNANLGYSLGGGFYDNIAQKFISPQDIQALRSTAEGSDLLRASLADGSVTKTDAGLNVGGYQLGKLYTIGNGLVNAGMAMSNADKLGKASADSRQLKTDIISTAASTPNVSNYLTTDEQRMLNQLRRGNYYEDGWGSDIGDWGNVLGGGLKGAIAGLPGGIPGAIVGAIGGAVNGGLSSATKKKANNNAKLDALYNTLNYARNDYNSMKRPNFSGLGIQQRYRDAYA